MFKSLLKGVLLLALALPAFGQYTANFYVSSGVGPTANATAGSDSNNGTSITTPFLTIDKARQAASALINGNCANISGNLVIALRGGSYWTGGQLSVPFTLSGGTSSYPSVAAVGNDTGCPGKQTYYESFPGEIAEVSGGIRETGFTNTGYNNGGTISQWSVNYSGAYFEQLYYTPSQGASTQTWSGVVVPISTRMSRPRVGATSGTSPAPWLNLCSVTRNTCNGAAAAVQPTDACSLSSNGCNGSTNASCTQQSGNGACADRARVPAGILKNWANLTGLHGQGSGCGGPEMGVFEVFTVPEMCIVAVDLVNNIAIFSGSFFSTTAFLTTYGPIDQHRFWIENEKDDNTNGCGIDLPGQWFLDNSKNPPVLCINVLPGQNPNTDYVEIPVLNQTMVDYNVNNVNFRRIMFEHDNFVIPAAGYVSFQGESGIWGAVSVQNSQTMMFQFDIFAHTSGDAIEWFGCRVAGDPNWCGPGGGNPSQVVNASGTSSGIEVQDSAIFDVGDNGANAGNKTVAATDTDANTNKFSTFSDNLIDGIGRRFPSAFGYYIGSGHDDLNDYNECHNTYHACIEVGVPPATFGSSNSHGIYNVRTLHNHLYDCIKGVTDDIGCLYYATGYGVGATNGATGTGNIIWWNKIHDVNDPTAIPPSGDPSAQGGSGIYLDNLTGSVDVRYNLVYRVSEFGLRLSKGTPLTNVSVNIGSVGPNIIYGNVFAFNRQAMVSTGNPSEWQSSQDTSGQNGSSPFNCTGSKRQQFLFSTNIGYFDRYDGSTGTQGKFFIQQGSPDTCGYTPYNTVQTFDHNYYINTNSNANPSTYAKMFHVAHATASPINSTGSQTNPTNWDYATFACWQSGGGCYTNNGGTSSTPVVDSSGEDPGAATGTTSVFNNVANDDFTVVGCPLAVASFPCSIYNIVTSAGRFLNTQFNPVVPDTFPTATFNKSTDY